MQHIEAQMHSLLEEIAKDVHNQEEQAKIIAVATSIYESHNRQKRLARKENPKIAEAHMTDALLNAMGTVNSWEDDNDYIDGRGLSHNQVLHRVAQTNKPKWGMMEVLNPDVISYLDFEDDDEVDSEQQLENAQQTSEALKTPGVGRHRSDFISAPIR
jgi:hypothetical protein